MKFKMINSVLCVEVTYLVNHQTGEVISSPAMSRNTLRKKMFHLCSYSRPHFWKFYTQYEPAENYIRN